MVRLLELALAALAFTAKLAHAQDEDIVEEKEEVDQSPNLAVSVSATFPDVSEIFGIKLVNGQPTNIVLDFSNEEPKSIFVNFVGGSLFTPDFDPQGSRNVRNLTAVQYALEIPAGEKESVTYKFATDMHPQELKLNLVAILSNNEGGFYTLQAFNGTVSVVDPDTSIFDPQIIFLYLILAGIFAGTIYLFYTIWIVPYFPKKRAGDRARRPAATPRKTDPLSDVGSGTDTPASGTATGAKAYNEDWIPAHHLQRPEAKRVKSGGPRPKSKGKTVE